MSPCPAHPARAPPAVRGVRGGNTLGAWNDFDPGEPATRHMTLEQLGDVVRSGGRIQWHTRSHRDLRQLSTSDVEDELDVPTDLRQRFAKPHLSWLSYPYGWHDERIVAIARKRFSGAVSVTDGEPADPMAAEQGHDGSIRCRA